MIFNFIKFFIQKLNHFDLFKIFENYLTTMERISLGIESDYPNGKVYQRILLYTSIWYLAVASLQNQFSYPTNIVLNNFVLYLGYDRFWSISYSSFMLMGHYLGDQMFNKNTGLTMKISVNLLIRGQNSIFILKRTKMSRNYLHYFKKMAVGVQTLFLFIDLILGKLI